VDEHAEALIKQMHLLLEKEPKGKQRIGGRKDLPALKVKGRSETPDCFFATAVYLVTVWSVFVHSLEPPGGGVSGGLGTVTSLALSGTVAPTDDKRQRAALRNLARVSDQLSQVARKRQRELEKRPPRR